MTSAILNDKNVETTSKHQLTELTLFLTNLKSGIWFVGIPSWVFGVVDRGVASLADNYVSPAELFQVVAASLFFMSWLFLKPDSKLSSEIEELLQTRDGQDQQYAFYLSKAKARMQELQKYHMISQEYILPFPYLCQIYHLLNLKHLESIHSFSLNNLRVISVDRCSPTEIGGAIQFQTVLDSPTNALRIWRQPVVPVDLTLLTPYTVELSIPVYNGKRITVIFNVLPLSRNTNKLFIDIFSDLGWYKPLLQVVLHIASCLTLFEDLPYLRKLAERNIYRLFHPTRVSPHKTMWLFNRFVALYGSKVTPEPVAAIAPSSVIEAGVVQ